MLLAVNECLESFYKILQQSEKMHEQGTCLFLNHLEIDAMKPFTVNWSIVKDQSLRSSTIHVWKNLNLNLKSRRADKVHFAAVKLGVRAVGEQLISSRHYRAS